MKRSIVYASALAVLFAACSKDEGATPVVDREGVVKELKISLVSSEGVGTRTVDGVGTEDRLYNAFVFVKADADGPADGTAAYEYKYMAVELKGGQTSTVVKHVQANSKVYVLANSSYFGTLESLEDVLEAVNKTPEKADAVFQALKLPIEKSYVSGLNTADGRFHMSGVATVPTLNTTGATVLNINVKRDLAKVGFKVNKAATVATLRIKEVEEITIRRSADHIQPFAVDGTAATTYVLPYGFGEALYKQDGMEKTTSFAPNNTTQTTDATDFSFIYTDKDLTATTATDFTFNDFYVLPNAAQIAEKGTIIVLKAKVEESTTADGTTTWTELAGSRYYKARISSAMTAYNTSQNSRYSIIATIKGEGNTEESGPDGPDKEDTENDLNITVQVEKWKLILSNQEIE